MIPENLSLLDLDTGILSLTFSETVDLLTFNASALTFTEGPNGTEFISLTAGSAILREYTILEASILPEDLNRLKFSDIIALSVNDTFLIAESFLIMDKSGNSLVEIRSANPLPASLLIGDETDPRLTQFSFSPDDALLVLTFSEIVDVIDTFRVTEIVLQTDGTARPTAAY